jgi:hypothetical protein
MQREKYQGSVEIAKGEYTGKYITNSPYSWNAYSYYLNGNPEVNQIHFRVIETGGGVNAPRKFHITLPVVDENGVANFHLNYFVDNRAGVRLDKYFPDNGEEVSPKVRQQAVDYLDKHRDSLNAVAKVFFAKVWK